MDCVLGQFDDCEVLVLARPVEVHNADQSSFLVNVDIIDDGGVEVREVDNRLVVVEFHSEDRGRVDDQGLGVVEVDLAFQEDGN